MLENQRTLIQISKLLRVLSILSISITAIALVLSLAVFVTTNHPASFSKYVNLGALLSAVGAGVAFLFSRILVISNCKRSGYTAPVRRSKNWAVVVIGTVLSLFILGRTFENVRHGPLDTDETYMASELLGEHPWSAINPVGNHRNHGVSSSLALFSTRVFGTNEMSVRYPSIVFTAFFLLLLIVFVHKYANAFVALLVFGNLTFNQLSIWFMHSMRGYISMMCFSLLALMLVMRWQDETPKSIRGPVWLFLAVFLLNVLTHTFGGIFSMLLWFTLLVWVYLNRNRLGEGQRKFFVNLLVACVALFPLVGLLFLSNAMDMSAYGFLYSKKLPIVSIELLRLFGVPNTEWVLVGVALCFIVFRSYWKKMDFLSLFLLCSSTMIFTLMFVIRSHIIEGRMFLAFLVLMVIWVGNGIVRLRSPLIRGVSAALAVSFLIIAPITATPKLFNVKPEILSDYNQFIKSVRMELKSKDQVCLIATGQPHQTFWAERLYLADYFALTSCRIQYQIHFAPNISELEQFGSENSVTLLEVLSDGKGRALYRKNLPGRTVTKFDDPLMFPKNEAGASADSFL